MFTGPLWMLITLIVIIIILAISFIWLYFLNHHSQHQKKDFITLLTEQTKNHNELFWKLNQAIREYLLERLNETDLNHQKRLTEFKETIEKALHQHRSQFDERQLSSLKILHDSLNTGMRDTRQEVTKSLSLHAEELSKRVDNLTTNTNERLKEISGQVEKRLSEGFEKTTATFTDIVKRLALIDEAQKKITELSSNVVSLQEILSDKSSRGAFGEVQLSLLIRNILPENAFSLQYTLSNQKRADCIIFLPDPTGNIVIDAKFPLENYRRLISSSLSENERHSIEQQFRQDLRKHIQDISTKYIILGETSDGAIMFIPAEAIFAEIHAHFPDIVDLSHQSHVWLASPTTMMAILTTIRAVLKDAATREQVHIIQEHLSKLGKDFSRFQERIDNLSKHIQQAHQDVKQVHTSAQKITSRFNKIEQVELDKAELTYLLEEETD